MGIALLKVFSINASNLSSFVCLFFSFVLVSSKNLLNASLENVSMGGF